MMKSTFGLRSLLLTACCVVTMATPLSAQTAQEGKNLGALARENLDKPRPAAPDDLTGTYNFDMRANGNPFVAYKFSPGPKLTPAAQAIYDKWKAYQAKGLEYRDDPAACWPLGMPRIMTRYWPLQIIQLPTQTVLVNMFDNNVRWIYTDGRAHPADDDLVFTYNGHSIGHWEGKTFVVDTVGLTDDHHWVEEGVPVSQNLHIVERYTKTATGMEIEFILTDPDNWVGEWKTTKKYALDDRADIEEHRCIYEQISKLPGFKQNIRE